MAAVQVFEGFQDGSAVYHCDDGYYYHYNNNNDYALRGNEPVHYLRYKNYARRGCTGTAKVSHGAEGVQWTNMQRHTCAPDRYLARVRNLRRDILDEATRMNGPYEPPAAVVERVRNG